ncbi:Nutrient germinant receptor inner membrane subunit A (GerKA/GerAA/GerBA) [Candidatus Syntrophocurvum alkaliphilum]|uniref:Nutrient germinant receptor inner membrane subunit A (GerKA/GerAA/GerBA) n=1 Tax=Candidatus Syntrophocurvum alkaliphilum TaxID=2293317 RepID=A0A6I6D967_9FIRM|nr:spore germination protein [Candidatus Syntrophocurvum alkaliphilum]QGT99395.1 Nutrient germinant receptor inner membrane subunit A (GerKA/GerAA/GerBA) [Candidatus Syntrophocurvum alkaliphilum]
MFRFLFNKLKYLGLKSANKTNQNNTVITSNLKQNIAHFKNSLGDSNDIIIREFKIGKKHNIDVALIYIDGMADDALITEVIKPLMYDINLKNRRIQNNIDYFKNELIAIGEIETTNSSPQLLAAILSGDTVLLINNSKQAIIIDTKGWVNRNVEEPDTERTVRGPREGFTETLRFNTTLLRRKIQNPNLVFEAFTIGKQTKTLISIAYIKNIANPKIVEEVKRRIERIDTDAILESGYIEQFIEDAPLSVFSTVGNSERPDKVAGKILEGRVAIIVDGTPTVLTVPMLFIEGFQAPEDYYSRYSYATLIRLVRLFGFLIALLLPSIYIALHSYHQELVPTPLLKTMATQTEGTPFPVVIEVILMGFIFEVLREAGVRLPNQIGPAITIVGSLIIGDAAVQAGLVGAPVIIVIALTTLTTFLAVPHIDAVTILRYVLVLLAGLLGGIGIAVGVIAIVIHLSSLRSFGVPYLSPLAPLTPEGLQDTLVRFPPWLQLIRPKLITDNEYKQSKKQKPRASKHKH